MTCVDAVSCWMPPRNQIKSAESSSNRQILYFICVLCFKLTQEHLSENNILDSNMLHRSRRNSGHTLLVIESFCKLSVRDYLLPSPRWWKKYIRWICVLSNNILSVLKSAVENMLFLMFLDCKTNSAVQERDLNKMAFVFEIWESTTDVFVSLTAGICGPN